MTGPQGPGHPPDHPPGAPPPGERFEVSEHTGELHLRRFRVGELEGADRDAVEKHLAGCESCQTKLAELTLEQASFEQQISFERFAGGVERASRVPSRPPPRAIWFGGITGLAAAAALAMVAFGPRPGQLGPEPLPSASGARNTLKGDGLGVDLRVAGPDGRQHSVPTSEPAALEAGARIRIGVRTLAPRYLVALSLDEQGEVSLLYPNGNESLALPAGPTTTYLPGSLEFLGQGQERVFVLLAEKPFATEAALSAARAALAKAEGDVARMSAPVPSGVSVETFSWLLDKPQ